ncbi:flavin reductase family protein [Demequina capsici]|uniref:Flavin reductase family protein n=1 Tax=Demequina capsici TaxID=3075620 RepID=A0AA96J9F5_9MICO|nr:flavin reductase family protein [Demequina sp. PMTSA13]WNM26340.1 flavin reductase family protein [Demequina sp. PMTSA13]
MNDVPQGPRDDVLAAHIAGVLVDVFDHEPEAVSARAREGAAATRAEDEALPVLAPADLKAALGLFASGVTVVSGMHEGRPAGFTCQSFFSVSLEPPLIALSVMATSTTFPLIRTADRIAVSVLADDQRATSSTFARSGGDRWAGIPWTPSPGGAPVLDGSLTWFECRIESEIEAGDHTLVIARITALGPRRPDAAPLVYAAGAYRTLQD